MNALLAVMYSLSGRHLPLAGILQSGFRSVPVVELTIQGLVLLTLICVFAGFYIGVRVNRPRYWD